MGPGKGHTVVSMSSIITVSSFTKRYDGKERSFSIFPKVPGDCDGSHHDKHNPDSKYCTKSDPWRSDCGFREKKSKNLESFQIRQGTS